MDRELWLNSSPVSKQTNGQSSGIVLGGLGTGGLEIWDDGRFHLWQIFNNGTFVSGRFRTPLPPAMPSTGLFFALRTETAGRAGLWKLHMPAYDSGEWIEEPYHVPELCFPESITFRGRQPFALLDYDLADCPLSVSLEAVTPFVIHDADTSAWPIAQFKMSLKNTGQHAVSAAAIASLLNCIGGHPSHLQAPHDLMQTDRDVTLSLPAPAGQEGPKVGSMALNVAGGQTELSYCRKWSPTDINTSLFWSQLEENNHLQNDSSKLAMRMSIAENAHQLGWKGADGQLNDLSEEQKNQLAEQLRQFPECRVIEHELPAYMSNRNMSPTDKRDILLDTVLRRLYANPPFFGSVARTVDLNPGQEAEIIFRFCWSFPFHETVSSKQRVAETTIEQCNNRTYCPSCGPAENAEKVSVGHRYEIFGTDAIDIARNLAPRFEDCERLTSNFVTALYDSSLPEWLCDAINAQFTSFVTNSWYTRDGRFIMWPGSGCCGFAEIGTGFFATIPLVLFYPELAKRQLEMVIEHQAEDGRVPHAFAGNFEELTVYYDDDYPKVILQVYRDWLWTGDNEYLSRVWPRLLLLLKACKSLDDDGDGIQDMRGHNQDYDQWMMFGVGTYTASHWPTALRMLVRMAHALGDTRHIEQWQQQTQQITRTIDNQLWTGEYYRLCRDSHKGTMSNALLANNLCGEWYARMTGLPASLPTERVRRNLQSVFNLNRQPGIGLKNGWLPPEEKRQIGNRDWHWNVCWLGTEYAVASHMIYEDMLEEGLTVCREGHERHNRQGLRYNHFECGEHYTRALDIWSVLLALQGFEWDAIRRRLTFVPKLDPKNHRSLAVVPTGWGRAEQKITKQTAQWRISIQEGTLALRELHLAERADVISLADEIIPFTQDEHVTRLARQIDLEAGDTLLVRFKNNNRRNDSK